MSNRFWEWLPRAYRDGNDGDAPKFTKYNMEVAFEAGAAIGLEKQQHDVWKLQFLTDVVTAAGLLSHGRQCKALAERISSDAMKIRQSLHTPPPEELPSKPIEDLREALQFLLSEQCKAKGYWAPGAELARLAIAKTTGASCESKFSE